MNSRQSKAMAELTAYYPRDWEEFYYSSIKIKAIKQEMDALGEKFLTAVDLAENDGSMARAAQGIKVELEKKKHLLIDAISEERKSISEAAQKERAAEAEAKRFNLAADANKIAKSAQKLSKIGMGIAGLIGIVTVSSQLYINQTKEERIKQQIVQQIEEKAISPLKQEIEKLKKENIDLKAVQESTSARILELKPKTSKKAHQDTSTNSQPSVPTSKKGR